ncbi:DinB family protein [Bradyrhizobium guangdongense]|uniref:Damage-inducible protein DinB n=1 Tax=Bradyrhizobium guangdongense TaxID=1325090 RepID=A0A410V7S6_9BRAD|nr:DinB family protein [Bradyrhizobium guangdongense]QAU39708.1 damage-inducible protein DinB [Bradyrhizobium guangdongense]QOZ60774.1 damage-inducible protein DinB [Bradyrhizobium guangdongense]GGI33561.1 damage-inducible protein DinB [Bradyrhizobium guangdongense]
MSAGLVQTYRAFAHNNAWANHRLLNACAGLNQADFEAPRTGFFPSIQRTLNHIYVIDLFYIDALEGGWLGPRAWANEVPYPSVSELKPAQATMDKRLLAICDALTPELLHGTIRINRDTRVQTERCDRLLMHLFQHQIHHRGQAHAMLSETAIVPPQLDEFFAEGEAPLRAAEFADLGWSEETVWKS